MSSGLRFFRGLICGFKPAIAYLFALYVYGVNFKWRTANDIHDIRFKYSDIITFSVIIISKLAFVCDRFIACVLE